MASEQDEIENEVMGLLSELEANQLEEACTVIPVDCPEPVKGKKNALLKLLYKHLLGLEETEDKGFAVYRVLHEFGKKAILDSSITKVKSETSEETSASPKAIKVNGFDVQKLRDLKISGTIGGSVEKDRLSYTSLSFQIQNAKKIGYSEENICGAVIKAISPNNYLRTYFESKPNLQLSSLLEVLRSHFKEKDSASVFTDLSNAAQLSTETCIDFAIRLMCLRQKVLDLSSEEGCQYDELLLNKRFRQTMLSGLKNTNIRAEIRENWKGSNSDEDLLKVVADAVTNEAERVEKLATKKEINAVNVIKKEENSKQAVIKKKENSVPEQIEKLKLSHQKEMSALRADLNEIKTALSANLKPGAHWIDRKNAGNSEGDRRKYRRKCDECIHRNAYRCFHCFVCGSSEHRMNVCPVRDKQKN